MRIGFLTTEFVTESCFSGGLAHYLYRVSRALVLRGHEVHVITLSEGTAAEFEHDGIRVCRVSRELRGRGCLNSLTRNRLRSTLTCLSLSYRLYGRLKQLHRQAPFDIVQFSNYNLSGLFANLLLSVPSMVRISSYTPVWHRELGAKPTLDAKVIEWLEKLQLRMSRHIYAPSSTLSKMVEEGAKVARVEVIRTPCYLETDDWDSSHYDAHLKGKEYLLFFGRFQLHKGFHILAQALPQVLRANPDCTAAFVGRDLETPLAPSMKDYALSLCTGHEDRLIFIRQIPHRQLYPVISGARLVVLPSLIDNFPNACLEAMALAKPVVGTRGASFEELIDEGKTGFLVPAGDVRALADKINAVWTDPGLAGIGKAAKQRVQEFSPERTMGRYLDYLSSVVQGNCLHGGQTPPVGMDSALHR